MLVSRPSSIESGLTRSRKEDGEYQSGVYATGGNAAAWDL